MGHARALLAIENPAQQISLYKDIEKRNYSVRQVESLVKQLKSSENTPEEQKDDSANMMAEQYNILTDKLSQFLQTKVNINISGKGKGKITIPFNDEDELLHIMTVLDTLRKL